MVEQSRTDNYKINQKKMYYLPKNRTTCNWNGCLTLLKVSLTSVHKVMLVAVPWSCDLDIRSKYIGYDSLLSSQTVQ